MKDYQLWSSVKQKINNLNFRPLGSREREIWICNLGENIGFEEDGKGKDFTRPVLILKVFNKNFCHVVPLSTTKKRGRYYYSFEGKTGKSSVALLSQSRAIDSARLREKIGYALEEDFNQIKNLIFNLIY